jgi:hypothetical protein
MPLVVGLFKLTVARRNKMMDHRQSIAPHSATNHFQKCLLRAVLERLFHNKEIQKEVCRQLDEEGRPWQGSRIDQFKTNIRRRYLRQSSHNYLKLEQTLITIEVWKSPLGVVWEDWINDIE